MFGHTKVLDAKASTSPCLLDSLMHVETRYKSLTFLGYCNRQTDRTTPMFVTDIVYGVLREQVANREAAYGAPCHAVWTGQVDQRCMHEYAFTWTIRQDKLP